MIVLTSPNCFAEFMEEYPQHIAPNNTMRFLSDNGGETYNLCHCARLISSLMGLYWLTRSLSFQSGATSKSPTWTSGGAKRIQNSSTTWKRLAASTTSAGVTRQYILSRPRCLRTDPRYISSRMSGIGIHRSNGARKVLFIRRESAGVTLAIVLVSPLGLHSPGPCIRGRPSDVFRVSLFFW